MVEKLEPKNIWWLTRLFLSRYRVLEFVGSEMGVLRILSILRHYHWSLWSMMWCTWCTWWLELERRRGGVVGGGGKTRGCFVVRLLGPISNKDRLFIMVPEHEKGYRADGHFITGPEQDRI